MDFRWIAFVSFGIVLFHGRILIYLCESTQHLLDLYVRPFSQQSVQAFFSIVASNARSFSIITVFMLRIRIGYEFYLLHDGRAIIIRNDFTFNREGVQRREVIRSRFIIYECSLKRRKQASIERFTIDRSNSRIRSDGHCKNISFLPEYFYLCKCNREKCFSIIRPFDRPPYVFNLPERIIPFDSSIIL